MVFERVIVTVSAIAYLSSIIVDVRDYISPPTSLPQSLPFQMEFPTSRHLNWAAGLLGENDAKQLFQGFTSALYILTFMSSIPLLWQHEAPDRDPADAFPDRGIEDALKTTDANDLLYAINASREYDRSTALEKIEAPLCAVNSADDQVNQPELGILEREIKKVQKGKAVVLPISEKTKGHGSHTWAVLWDDVLEELLRESEKKA